MVDKSRNRGLVLSEAIMDAPGPAKILTEQLPELKEERERVIAEKFCEALSGRFGRTLVLRRDRPIGEFPDALGSEGDRRWEIEITEVAIEAHRERHARAITYHRPIANALASNTTMLHGVCARIDCRGKDECLPDPGSRKGKVLVAAIVELLRSDCWRGAVAAGKLVIKELHGHMRNGGLVRVHLMPADPGRLYDVYFDAQLTAGSGEVHAAIERAIRRKDAKRYDRTPGVGCMLLCYELAPLASTLLHEFGRLPFQLPQKLTFDEVWLLWPTVTAGGGLAKLWPDFVSMYGPRSRDHT